MGEFDSQTFRTTMSQFCTGVAVVTACHEDEPVGFTAQSFVSLSLEPPLVAVCPGKDSTSWPRIRAAGRFCVNMLAADQEHLSNLFAQTTDDKFTNVTWRPGVTGSPILEGVIAYTDCLLEVEHDAGDHTIAVGRVQDLQVLTDALPLLYFRSSYRSVAVS